jgi:hypothetical protein
MMMAMVVMVMVRWCRRSGGEVHKKQRSTKQQRSQ